MIKKLYCVDVTYHHFGIEIEAANEEEAIQKACELAWQLDADSIKTKVTCFDTVVKHLCYLVKDDQFRHRNRIYTATSAPYMTTDKITNEWCVDVACQDDPITRHLCASACKDGCVEVFVKIAP